MPKSSALTGWQSWWATPLVGLLGGYLASLIGWPLPWIIGSLLAVIAARCSGWLITEMPGGAQNRPMAGVQRHRPAFHQ